MRPKLRVLLCLAAWPVGIPYLLRARGHAKAAAGFALGLGVALVLGLSAVPWKSALEPSAPVGESREVPPQRAAYKVLSDRRSDRARRNVEVRLTEKVTSAVLQSLAYEIRDLDPTRYDRTFIFYFLPDAPTNRAAWATTHFRPDLEVEIRGTTREQDQQVSGSGGSPGER